MKHIRYFSILTFSYPLLVWYTDMYFVYIIYINFFIYKYVYLYLFASTSPYSLSWYVPFYYLCSHLSHSVICFTLLYQYPSAHLDHSVDNCLHICLYSVDIHLHICHALFISRYLFQLSTLFYFSLFSSLLIFLHPFQ